MTSRERNPQFCGSPPRFRDRGFYSIQPEELSCSAKDRSTTTTTTISPTIQVKKNPEETKQKESVGVATVVSADLDDLVQANPDLLTSTSSTTKLPARTTTVISTSSSSTTSKVTTASSTTSKTTTSSKLKAAAAAAAPVWKTTQKPPVVLAYPGARGKADESKEVIVKNAFRQDNAVIIQWGSETANILGFRVVYRLFGDKSFKQGPPLEASEREFKIKNVPSQVSGLQFRKSGLFKI